MPDVLVYDDAGPLVAGLRLVAPAARAPRPARILAGAAVLTGTVALGPAWVPLGVLVLVGLAGPVERRASRLWWLVPGLLRAVEYGLVVAVAVGAGAGALPAAFGLLIALSFHHYDLVYRVRYARLTPPSWLSLAGGGFDARMLVVAVLAAVGGSAFPRGVTALAAALGMLFVAESVTAWSRWLRGAPVADAGE